METDKHRSQGFLLADSNVSGCFITSEESMRVAQLEGISLSEMPSSKHLDNSISSTPKINKAVISESYIIITCDDNADPKFNRLQLRTDPLTFIELQPGRNILMIEDYPTLKFGFKQIDDNDNDEHMHLSGKESVIPNENCQEVIEVDFSHFDGSEMESMDYMFHFMSRIERITFGEMKTSKLTSMERAFWGVGNLHDGEPILDLDLSGLDFSNVANANDMFSDAIIRRLDLTGCNFENLNESGIFGETYVKHLILDNCKFRNVEDLDAWSDYRGLMEVSLKGWSKDDCRDFILEMERGRSKFIDFHPTAIYHLDSKYSYRINQDSDEKVICEIKTTMTPYPRLWPMDASVPYSISQKIHQLTLMEFINRLTQPHICKGGRFVIAFINAKDKTLIFPDEAARLVNKYGEIYSGYYEEFEVTYPEIMDLNIIFNTYPLSQPLVARTKRSGTLPIIDVVPFEYNDFAFNAIVVDQVIDNGVCSTVKNWLLDHQDQIEKSTDYEAKINAPRTDLDDLYINPSSETDFPQSPRRKPKKNLRDLYNRIANENPSDS